MKNWKLSRKITLGIALIVILCMSLLYFTANRTITKVMQESESAHMTDNLSAQSTIIDEYVSRQEDILTAYSKAPAVRELLKDPKNEEKLSTAQTYTENFYKGLSNWEGIYIGEWNTHVIAHSNKKSNWYDNPYR